MQPKPVEVMTPAELLVALARPQLFQSEEEHKKAFKRFREAPLGTLKP